MSGQALVDSLKGLKTIGAAIRIYTQDGIERSDAADINLESAKHLVENFGAIMISVTLQSSIKLPGQRRILRTFRMLNRNYLGNRANASRIRDQSITEGMQLLIEDGIAKIIAGTTTPDEVLRVTVRSTV